MKGETMREGVTAEADTCREFVRPRLGKVETLVTEVQA